MPEDHDVLIIGGGPAGITAGLYCSRDRLETLLIERGLIGGMINEAEKVDNYPGFPEGISGTELTQLMHQQATRYGLKTIYIDVIALQVKNKSMTVKTTSGSFGSRAVIIASGSERQKLGIPGEKEYTGKGVSYCATCDAPFFNGKTVAIVGGGNAAIYEALHLAKFAAKVFLIHRRDQLRATAIVQERAFAEPKIEFLWNTVVDAIEGGKTVENLNLRQVTDGKKYTLKVSGVFIAIGIKANTGFLKGVLALDKRGCIVVNERMETSVPGIFAAGDIRSNSIGQVVAAAGDGATAALYAKNFIES
ncbi:MAG TPA: thioredoxin-disulfide reductase [Dehalococcoidia bacterium]|nr:thioredoxin-disulfide reductase [Dehalococcoidia bacterium]